MFGFLKTPELAGPPSRMSLQHSVNKRVGKVKLCRIEEHPFRFPSPPAINEKAGKDSVDPGIWITVTFLSYSLTAASAVFWRDVCPKVPTIPKCANE